MSSDTCIHWGGIGNGLCPSCEEMRDADPLAWEEYGCHIQGQLNWNALQEEIAAEAAVIRAAHDASCEPDHVIDQDDIPW